MRPPIHPSPEEITVEAVLHALSDPVRVAIFAGIVGSQCSQSCSEFLTVGDRPIPKSTLSQHFRILREAGLVRSERRGVEMHNTGRCGEVDKRFPGLIAAIVKAHNLECERKRSEGRTAGRGAGRRKPSSQRPKEPEAAAKVRP